MAKIKIAQIAIAMCSDSMNGGEERALFVDDKGRVWYELTVPDKERCEYDGEGRLTKSFYKTEWRQLELPEEPQL